MESITNEQKLYVLLDNTHGRTDKENEPWRVLREQISPDTSWYEGVADILVSSGYLKRSYAYSRVTKESRVIYDTTDDGRRQIPILWNGSELRRMLEEEEKTRKKESSFKEKHGILYKILWATITAVIASLATILMNFAFGKE